jgi:hypothetical protein
MLNFMLMKVYFALRRQIVYRATSKLMHLHVTLNIPCLWCSQYVRSIIGEFRFPGGLLVTLFKFQMTQYRSIPLSCSGSSSCNCLPSRLPPWRRVFFFIKLKIYTLYETPCFIAAYTTARHLALSWYRSINFMLSIIFCKIHFNIILQISIDISSNLSP